MLLTAASVKVDLNQRSEHSINVLQGIRSAYQQQCVSGWRSRGVKVTISTCDVGKPGEAEQILNDQVGGIFHLAMILRDGLFTNQTQQSFEAVCAPKCKGVTYLDRWGWFFLENNCAKLEFAIQHHVECSIAILSWLL